MRYYNYRETPSNNVAINRKLVFPLVGSVSGDRGFYRPRSRFKVITTLLHTDGTQPSRSLQQPSVIASDIGVVPLFLPDIIRARPHLSILLCNIVRSLCSRFLDDTRRKNENSVGTPAEFRFGNLFPRRCEIADFCIVDV